MRRSVLQWRFIDSVAARIDEPALREAQSPRTRSAPTSSCTPRSARERGRTRSGRLGIDVGTTGVKGLALDADGGVLAGAEAGYPLSTPRPGWAEQDPEDWWRAAEAVLAQLRAAAGPRGIGLSGQMHGLVALDAADRVLRPAILWNDQRTAAECAEIEEAIGLERLIALTGNRALPGFTAPKLLWLRAPRAGVFARIARIVLPKDYVRLRLCGELATDVSDASARCCSTSPAGAGARRCSTPWRSTPRGCRRCSRARGERATAEGVPVAAGAGDQAAGALGVGVDGPGPVSVVLGTSGVVFAALERSRQTRRRASTRSATRCPARGTRWA